MQIVAGVVRGHGEGHVQPPRGHGRPWAEGWCWYGEWCAPGFATFQLTLWMIVLKQQCYLVVQTTVTPEAMPSDVAGGSACPRPFLGIAPGRR
jgi:hypothetical protein